LSGKKERRKKEMGGIPVKGYVFQCIGITPVSFGLFFSVFGFLLSVSDFSGGSE